MPKQDREAMYKNLQSHEFMQNPYPTILEMQKQGELIAAKVPVIGRVWFTTNQAMAARVLKDDKTFSMRKEDGSAVGLNWWMPKYLKQLTSNMLTTDEPDHRRLRSFVDTAFQRVSVLNAQKDVDELATAYRKNLHARGDEVDLVSEFARPFPLAVICKILGLPNEDHAQFMTLATRLTDVSGTVSFLRAVWNIRPISKYITDRVERAHTCREDGLINRLVALPEDRLENEEIVAMVFLLLMAGHETTTHLISGSIFALFENPHQLQLLKNDPTRIDLAVEELLRFVSPVMVTKPRYVRHDCDLAGENLKKGDYVMPLLIAANYDPAVFEAPDKLNLLRQPNRHMEFGTGIHFCLGHQLARIELRAALNTLVLANEPIRTSAKAKYFEWNKRFGMRSLKRLLVSG